LGKGAGGGISHGQEQTGGTGTDGGGGFDEATMLNTDTGTWVRNTLQLASARVRALAV